MPRPSRPCPRDALSGGSGSIAQPPPLPLAQADGGRQAAADTDGTYSYAPWPWCTLRLYRGAQLYGHAGGPCIRCVHQHAAAGSQCPHHHAGIAANPATQPIRSADPPRRGSRSRSIGRLLRGDATHFFRWELATILVCVRAHCTKKLCETSEVVSTDCIFLLNTVQNSAAARRQQQFQI
jgi:hypothetical protein